MNEQLDRELAYAAYHEAGHAVAAYVLGYGLHAAFILPRDDPHAGCHFVERYRSAWEEAGEDRCASADSIVALAGHSAEMMRFDVPNIAHARPDIQFAYQLACDAAEGFEQAELDVYRTFALAETLIRENGKTVQTLAAALLRYRGLAADQAREIIRNTASVAH
ncbi:MAG: hypothetical protein NTZ05_17875 [Chloroflexi bacterium]|nr:hypothetical protein [Chloroflexota bacterium]